MGEWAVLRLGGKRGEIPAVVDAWGTWRKVEQGWNSVHIPHAAHCRLGSINGSMAPCNIEQSGGGSIC